MADLIPWDELAAVFFSSMSAGEGRPSVDLRIVLGVLLVKHIENLSDERAIKYVQENIYAQYFVGLSSFQVDPVFVPHLLVTIRKRLGKEGSAQLNDLLIEQAVRVKALKHRQRPSDKTPRRNRLLKKRLNKHKRLKMSQLKRLRRRYRLAPGFVIEGR